MKGLSEMRKTCGDFVNRHARRISRILNKCCAPMKFSKNFAFVVQVFSAYCTEPPIKTYRRQYDNYIRPTPSCEARTYVFVDNFAKNLQSRPQKRTLLSQELSRTRYSRAVCESMMCECLVFISQSHTLDECVHAPTFRPCLFHHAARRHIRQFTLNHLFAVFR